MDSKIASPKLMRIAAPLDSSVLPDLQWIEVASFLQIPNFQIIGLPAPEITEARERVRASIHACGFEFPRRRVVVNLSPASVKKRGTGVDLAIALAILASTHKDAREFPVISAWGELGLNGRVKSSSALTRAIYATWKAQVPYLFLSQDDYQEGVNLIPWIEQADAIPNAPPVLVPVGGLKDAWESYLNIVSGKKISAPNSPTPIKPETDQASAGTGLLPISGSMARTLGVSASGAHHLLLLGAKGSGKSHAIEWLIQIQPPPTARARLNHHLLLELSRSKEKHFSGQRIRRVGIQTRPAALLGQVSSAGPKPGELALANGGLVIADEFPEWPRDTREALREPLERGQVTLSQAQGSTEFPSQFVLIATGNLCSCGGLPDEFLETESDTSLLPKCTCTSFLRRKYLKRLSGPILDRIDLIVIAKHSHFRNQHSAPFDELSSKVNRTRNDLLKIWGAPPGQMAASELEFLLKKHPDWAQILESLRVESLRSKHKVLRVALTLAAWDRIAEPSAAHFIEASYYRPERLGLCD